MTDIDRVLVTGAAGLVGRGVLHQLRESETKVTALVRRDPGDLDVDRVVVGDTGDPDAMAQAVDGADGVIHLAAIPTPDNHPPQQVFASNVAGTFNILEAAGAAGIRRICLASSINAVGLTFNPHADAAPPYVPWDAHMPSIAADAYSLSKGVDEVTAQMMHRRHGMDIVALRYPFVGGMGDIDGLDDRLAAALPSFQEDPGTAARDMWAYLETRDAGRAAVLSLSPTEPGVHVLWVAAPENSVHVPTEELLDRYWPQVPRRRALPGYEVPFDLAPTERIIEFRAENLLYR